MSEKIDPTFGLKLTQSHGIGQNSALPYIICRGAVFASTVYARANANHRPVYTRPTCLARFGAMEVFQTAGEQLDQQAGDVYLECVRRAVRVGFKHEEEIRLRFDADEFLEAIGRTRGGNQRLWLAQEIARLKRASYRYDLPGLAAWETSFVSDFVEDRSVRGTKTTAHYEVVLNRKMYEVYKAGYVFLLGGERAALHKAGDPLAKALYAFFRSHSDPKPISANALKEHMGRAELRDDKGKVIKPAQQDSKWLSDLEKSLANLQKATGWPVCQLNRSNRLVTVKRKTAAAPADDQEANDKPAAKKADPRLAKRADKAVVPTAPPAKTKAASPAEPEVTDVPEQTDTTGTATVDVRDFKFSTETTYAELVALGKKGWLRLDYETVMAGLTPNEQLKANSVKQDVQFHAKKAKRPATPADEMPLLYQVVLWCRNPNDDDI